MDIFDKPEKEIIEAYDSGKTAPLVVFLGLNESQAENGFIYKSYKGVPYFALDITPRGILEEKAKQIIGAMESKELTFNKARAITSLPSNDGMTTDSFSPSHIYHNELLTTFQSKLPYMRKLGTQ